MAPPRLPFELFQKIVQTSKYLERLDVLHGSRLWRSVRWFTGNADVTEVPKEWAANHWLLQLVRALCNPNVHNIHLATDYCRRVPTRI